MSFVKKAVKKVFKGVKRLWENDWFKAAAGVALGLFVAGAAGGGWNWEGGFTNWFKAVGDTIAKGWDKVTGWATNLFTGGASGSAAQKAVDVAPTDGPVDGIVAAEGTRAAAEAVDLGKAAGDAGRVVVDSPITNAKEIVDSSKSETASLWSRFFDKLMPDTELGQVAMVQLLGAGVKGIAGTFAAKAQEEAHYQRLRNTFVGGYPAWDSKDRIGESGSVMRPILGSLQANASNPTPQQRYQALLGAGDRPEPRQPNRAVKTAGAYT